MGASVEMTMSNKVIVTGGTGFAGGHFIIRLLMTTDYDVVSIERKPSRKQTALGPLSLCSRIRRVYHDLRSPFLDVDEFKGAKYLVHCGAEVSGITSLLHPVLTISTNVVGTYNVLELAQAIGVERFVYVSSGEAVGAVAPPLSLDENAPLRPSNPYAASKAAGEELCRAWYYSFGVPAVVVRTMNLFGKYQGVERFVPMVVKKILNGDKVVCHVGPDDNCGSRNWLPVDDFVEKLAWLMEDGKPGETYHVVGPERTNLQVIDTLASVLNPICPPHVENVIPGPSHDMRYSLTNTKLPKFYGDLDEELRKVARWHANNREWLS